MKKTLLTSIAALFLATGTAHADDQLPETMLGRWCEAGTKGPNRIYYRPSFQGRLGCVDFDDGITLSQTGFSDDRPIDQCYKYVFDKIEQMQNGYLVSAHCEKVEDTEDTYNPEGEDLAGTRHLQLIHDDILIVTKMPEG
jgi:hypothetical protein